MSAAAIALAGCGGGGSASSSEASTASTDAAATAEAGGSAGSVNANGSNGGAGAQGQDQGQGQGQGQSSGSGGHARSASGGSDGGSGKHGPRIDPPHGKREQPVTPQQAANATVADIQLTSPAIVAAAGHPGRLASTYTCDGEGHWPALEWNGVPAGTSELILYAMNLQPVEGRLFVDWAVAGLDPSLQGIEAGKLPKGAIVGTNSFGKRGYELCPEGGGEIYMFALYALPRSLNPRAGFDARELRRTIPDVSGDVGLLPAVYERG